MILFQLLILSPSTSLVTMLIKLVDKRLIQLIDTFFMIFFLEIIFNFVIFDSKTFLSYFVW